MTLLERCTNRRAWLVAFVTAFVTGAMLVLIGTFRPDERVPARVAFPTEPATTAGLNAFFNRSVAGPDEDAQNKLLEDYTVRGYVIEPPTAPPAAGYPAVVWLHGFAMNAEIQLNVPRQLAKAGFLVLALNQPGHGDSGGRWDMGLQTLAGVYSAVKWLTGASPYQARVDATRVGVAGHSMGGIATTRAGIFDNWTNPTTGRPVGTGGGIRACGAVYCWDDLETMAEQLVQDFLGLPDIWEHPTIEQVLSQWRWFSNHAPASVPVEARLRSVTPFISLDHMPNYCLVTGSADFLTSVPAQSYIMANATRDAGGTPAVTAAEIRATVAASPHHTWNHGAMTEGTARRLVIRPGVGHLGEAIDRTVCQNLTYWFQEAMACTSVTPDLPPGPLAWQAPFLVKMGGWVLLIVGALGATLPAFSYAWDAINARLPAPRRQAATALTRPAPPPDAGTSTISPGDPPASPRRPVSRLTPSAPPRAVPGLALVAPAGVLAACGLFSLRSLTRFWIFDLIVPYVALAAAFLWGVGACVVVVASRQARRFDRSPGRHPGRHPDRPSTLASFFGPACSWRLHAAALAALAGVLVACIAFLDAFWLAQVPVLAPRPLDPGVVWDYVVLLLAFLAFFLPVEVLFRGVLHPRLLPGRHDKPANWRRVALSALASGVVLGTGTALGVTVALGPLFRPAPALLGAVFAGSVALFFVSGLVPAWIYQRCRSVVPGAVYVAVMASLLVAGKLFLTYA